MIMGPRVILSVKIAISIQRSVDVAAKRVLAVRGG
jgi:hypothetical protein